MSDKIADPEASYRRGYQQGAFVAMEAVEKFGRSVGGLGRLRIWAGLALSKWRYHDRPGDRNLRPPPPPSN